MPRRTKQARRTRAETAEHNRKAVLAAARDHFERHGYHGASLDEIADQAGFSKGAVYSRFAGKDDLFLAVLADHIEHRHAVTEAEFAALDGPEDMARLMDAAVGTSVATAAWQAALLEFRAHAWRHPDINRRYGELHRRTIDSIAGFMADLYRRGGQEPPAPTALLAVAGLAVGTGAVTEYMSDPDLDAAELTRAMAVALRPVLAADAKDAR